MTFGQETTLLLIGAGIGFVSGLVSSLITTWVNHYLQKKTSDVEKKEKALNLFGQLAGKRVGQGHIEWEEFLNDSKSLKEEVKKLVDSPDNAALVIGLIQEVIKEQEVLEYQRE